MSAVRISRRRDFKIQSATGRDFSPQGPALAYQLEVCIEGDLQEKTGMLMNIRDLDTILQLTLKEFENKATAHATPALAQELFNKIRPSITLHNARLLRVRLKENDDLWYDVWA